MEVMARARYLRISPRKARLVADLVRGKKVDEALGILAFTKKKFARQLTKIIQSAVANAEHNTNMDVDSLWIKRIFVDQGPMLKRYRPRAMGRATMIRRRTSHVTVVLDEMKGR
ncbi:MAG: 50S ribosomal protein L22 [Deltaproteobacteria bacterium]|nr:MAG: 50S ribosomal protein L22 [Deltaproteobacteria bacterium]RLA98105.1 MAG: 50S ribosomal protein L22 [Deltaproteobacteria bacterium]